MAFLPVYPSPKNHAHLQKVIDQLRKSIELTSNQLTDVDSSVRPTVTVDANVAVGQVVYATTADHVGLARANAIGTSKLIGIAGEAVTSGNDGFIVTAGLATVSNITLVTNTLYFLSAVTAGLLVSTIDATAGQFIVPVGRAVATDKLLITGGPIIQL